MPNRKRKCSYLQSLLNCMFSIPRREQQLTCAAVLCSTSMMSSPDETLVLRLREGRACDTGVWRCGVASRSGPGVSDRRGMLSPRPPSLWMSSRRLLMSVRSLSGGSPASRVRGVVSSGSSPPPSGWTPPPASPGPPPTPPPCSRGAAGPPLQRPLSPISRITSPPARGDHQHMEVRRARSGPRPAGGPAPSPAAEGGGRSCGHHRARRRASSKPATTITTLATRPHIHWTLARGWIRCALILHRRRGAHLCFSFAKAHLLINW
nr:uncharacterized protein LOC113810069 [Penaeus vannamei]